MKIAICDDRKIIREQLRDYCLKYVDEFDMDNNIIEFNSGEEVLMSDEVISLLFLDIKLPGINGIEVKEILLKKDNIEYIVFISGYVGNVWNAFSKKTLGFVKKPFFLKDIYNILCNYKKDIDNSISIDLPTANGIIPVKTKNIVYINAQNIYTEVITEKEVYLVRESLNDWEDKLKKYNFIRVHKSYLINMIYIDKIDGYQLNLINGIKLKIGRTKLIILKNEYYNYCKTRDRY